MKLGSETGSLMNHVMASGNQPSPVVGMGCTILMWSDRHAATVIAVENKLITVQEDEATRTDNNGGMSEMQEYEYRPNTNGVKHHFRLNKNGGWDNVQYNMETKRWNKTKSCGISLGTRRTYYDFSF